MEAPRWISLTALIALGVMTATQVADAQGNVCIDLQTRLAALDRGDSAQSMANYRSYDQAVSQQRNEIDQATAEARRAGCLGGGFFFNFSQRRPEAKCGELMATIDQMRANLTRLSTERNQYGRDPYATTRERNEIVRALAANRCQGGGYATNDGGAGNRGLLATLFGQGRVRTWGEDNYYRSNQYGTYRTLCVRTCDGYYFPISFSTVPNRFAADLQTCQAMCPGVEADLYVYHNPGEEADAMVSISGQPYSALPTAFRYRTEYDPSCACGSTTAQSTFDEFSAQAAALTPGGAPLLPIGSVPLMPRPLVAQPTPRPALGEDPETQANRLGGLVPGPVAKPEPGGVAGLSADGSRKIRIVGPEYYVAQ